MISHKQRLATLDFLEALAVSRYQMKCRYCKAVNLPAASANNFGSAANDKQLVDIYDATGRKLNHTVLDITGTAKIEKGQF
jgi:hypothetical protein